MVRSEVLELHLLRVFYDPGIVSVWCGSLWERGIRGYGFWDQLHEIE